MSQAVFVMAEIVLRGGRNAQYWTWEAQRIGPSLSLADKAYVEVSESG